MKNDQKHPDSFLEIIFENRHKSYGAYAIRSHYEERLRNAFLFSLAFLGLLFIAIRLMIHFSPGGVILDPMPGAYHGPIIMQNFRIPGYQLESTPQDPNHQFVKVVNRTTVKPEKKKTKTDASPATHFSTSHFNHDMIPSGGGGGREHEPILKPMQSLGTFTPKAPIKIADVMPSFPGGPDKLYEFINSHIRFPERFIASGLNTTKAYVQFVVEPDGKVDNIRVIKDGGFDTGMEGYNVVAQMPDWIPGVDKGEKVPVYIVLPINFSVK